MFSRRFITALAPRLITRRMVAVKYPTNSFPISSVTSSRQLSSIKDMFSDYASNKMNESKEKQFQKMVDTMVGAEKWTFRTWKSLLEDQLNSWVMYIPGMSSSKDAESLKELKGMLDAMTEAELDDPSLVNGAARERIAKASGKPIDQVRSLIYLHKNTRFYHLVLKMRKQHGDPLPKAPSEMTKMFEEDPRVRPIFQEVFMADSKKPKGRGRRSFR